MTPWLVALTVLALAGTFRAAWRQAGRVGALDRLAGPAHQAPGSLGSPDLPGFARIPVSPGLVVSAGPLVSPGLVAVSAGPPVTLGRRQRRWLPLRLPGRGGPRRRSELAVDLVATLDDVASGLRSGTSLLRALAQASSASGGPARSGLAGVVGDTMQGSSLDRALGRWADHEPDPAVALVASALSVAAGSGGAPAAAVDAVSATLRERLGLAGEVRAQSAQARASAAVLVCVPLGFAVAAGLADRRLGAFLLASPAGWACLAVGLVLDLAGAVWMARMVRGATP